MILIILTVRLFRFFKLQPQLAVISKTVLQAGTYFVCVRTVKWAQISLVNTISEYAPPSFLCFNNMAVCDTYPVPELAHLIFMMAVLMFGFAQCAVFAYGTQIEAFASLPVAFRSVFFMTLGDYGEYYTEMADKNNPLADLFIGLIVGLMVMTTLNIFLAIIIDTFQSVKEELHDELGGNMPSMLADSIAQIKKYCSPSGLRHTYHKYFVGGASRTMSPSLPKNPSDLAFQMNSPPDITSDIDALTSADKCVSAFFLLILSHAF
jgi:hypothetical protein